MATDYEGEPDPPAFVPKAPPYVDEAFPATGRRSGLIERQRQDSGGLSDDDRGDPVVDNNPFRPRR